MSLSDIQYQFDRALSGEPNTLSDMVLSCLPAQDAITIYQNNTQGVLESVLQCQFPWSKQLIGDERFTSLMRIFIDDAGRSADDLNVLGRHFVRWAVQYLQQSDMQKYNSDFQELLQAEVYLHDAYYAFDDKPLNLVNYSEDALVELKFVLASHVFIMESYFDLSLLECDKQPKRIDDRNVFVFYRHIDGQGHPVKVRVLDQNMFFALSCFIEATSISDLIRGDHAAKFSDSCLELMPSLIEKGYIVSAQKSEYAQC